nr:hypothetical protein [Clostridia bacterium]
RKAGRFVIFTVVQSLTLLHIALYREIAVDVSPLRWHADGAADFFTVYEKLGDLLFLLLFSL